MIVDSLENASIYQNLNPLLRQGFDYLRDFDPGTPDGRIEIAGSGLYVLVQTFRPDPPERRQFEAHRRYLDVQWVFQGTETIYFEQVQRLTPATDYDQGRDILFFEDPPLSSEVVLQRGDFALILPQDAHKPCCVADSYEPVRKAVLKIRIANDHEELDAISSQMDVRLFP